MADSENPTNPTEEQSIDTLHDRPIVQEMSESYLDYAMSVIVSRALPDVRDGLKPVHRRILYTMHKLGLRSGAKFRKSAAVVGDVLGKYHPHGDSSVYDAMARMAQDFSMRYPLVLGQGNFGSIDGDNPAAMRYTEAKMQKITDDVLADIEKETVPFRDNYDGVLQEPTVLPSKLPTLLLNGTMGIAVGMATNIPPHNLNEICDAALHVAENEDCTIEDLMEIVKGPDFPTAGEIYDPEAIKAAYATGRGSIIMRGKAKIEEGKSGKQQIIISEIPYQVNKASLVTKIADLVRDKKIQGITDLRDESDMKEIRIVIDLKRGSFPKKVLNQIFKLTPLQSSFGLNMIALIDGGLQPRLLNLKSVLEHFIEHRKEVITNRVKYELKLAKARAHILEGLKKALDHIDKVIATIKASKTKEDAKEALMKKFKLSDLQADAILNMRLQTLAGLERKKIEDELKEKLAFIKECEEILADPKKVMAIMKNELEEMKEKYGDERRTEVIGHALGKFSAKDTVPNARMIVALTRANYIKRLPPETFKAQNRGGKGVKGMGTKEEDEIMRILYTMNHNTLLYFTNRGRVFQLPVYEIPKATRQSKGVALVNLLQLEDGEYVTALLDSNKREGKYFCMATKNGVVKKTSIEDFKNVRKSGLIAIKLRDNDELRWVGPTEGEHEVMLVTKQGQCIRFDEQDVRPMGRASTGVRGIKLKGDDRVIEMDILRDPDNMKLLNVMENGLAKASKLSEYRKQNRGGSGIKVANVTAKTGPVVAAKAIRKQHDGDLLCISKNGQTMRTQISAIPVRGRNTQGVIAMRLKGGDKVASVSIIELKKDDDEKVEAPKKEAKAEKKVEKKAEKKPAKKPSKKTEKKVAKKPAKKTDKKAKPKKKK